MSSTNINAAAFSGGVWILLLIIFLSYRCILGAVSWKVSYNRGRYGGFWWGFFLGVVGIIVEACRPLD